MDHAIDQPTDLERGGAAAFSIYSQETTVTSNRIYSMVEEEEHRFRVGSTLASNLNSRNMFVTYAVRRLAISNLSEQQSETQSQLFCWQYEFTLFAAQGEALSQACSTPE